MCGILCLLTKNAHRFDDIYEKCVSSIKRRGPDAFNELESVQHGFNLKLAASILWLQGENINIQPIETDTSIFAYNGDIFDGNLINHIQRRKDGDTNLFLNALNENADVFTTLKSIQGPYAFIYFDKTAAKLYFSRDVYGRRSLLIAKSADGIIITSVACKTNDYKFIELPALGLFSYDLNKDEFDVRPWNDDVHITRFDDFNNFISSRFVITRNPQIKAKLGYFKGPSETDLELYRALINEKIESPFEFLCQHNSWDEKVNDVIKLLEGSIEKRISNQPKYCRDCIIRKQTCSHSRVGVLFSGGIDCTILALIADKFIEKNCSIDLINVAFGNFNTPDRNTGLSSFEELKTLRPERAWNFVPIDISDNELNSHREQHIKHLIYPLKTIVDDSLGCAIWFASRGRNNDYTSPARVLLVGMGADELFGGYTKHRRSFNTVGWEGLHDSMENDWRNISVRNLGRDDRMVSDHGRQLRTPYLDENFVNYVRGLDVWQRTFPTKLLTEGVGDKILLRCVGYKLGLLGASKFRKRALQFGCRIANSKENAHEESPRL